MARCVLICTLFLLAGSVSAQEPKYLDLVKSEVHLEELFNQLYSDSLSDREQVLTTILEIMPEALNAEGAMDFPWKGLSRIGVVTSENQMIRIFTWHVTDSPDKHRYFGFIQVAMKKGGVGLYRLKDNGISQKGLTNLEQSPDNWYGKLYYNIIQTTHKRKTYYTLLGMDFNNSRSTIKTIEALDIHRNQPRFVRKLFFNGREKQDRMVFEYSSQVAISVRFDKDVGMITFDHLVPFHPIYQNNYEFYGPDGSFDGLEFEEGTWIFHADIDARNMN